MTKFKERLKELRNDKTFSQGRLAEELNVAQSSISGWETGYREPDFDTLVKIAAYFKVSTDYLLGIKDF